MSRTRMESEPKRVRKVRRVNSAAIEIFVTRFAANDRGSTDAGDEDIEYFTRWKSGLEFRL